MHPPIVRASARARRGQLALIATAVTMSVALSVASFEFAALIGSALGTDAPSASGNPDEATAAVDQVPDGAVVLTARTSAVTTATALDDELINQVRQLDGVLEATGTFDQPVSFRLDPDDQPERPAALRGVVFSAAFSTPWELVSGRAPSGADEVVVDAGGAVVGQVAEGTVAELELPTGRRNVTIVGIASFGPPDSSSFDLASPSLSDAHVLFDPEWIGPLLGAVGRVDRITVIPQPGLDRDELADQITDEVGPGIRVTATSDPSAVTQQTVARLDDGVRLGTRAFALLTAIVAVIVVANVYSVVLAPRTRELALLKLVGASRRQVLRWLLAEAALVGAAATVVGFGVGVALGSLAVRLVQTGSADVGIAVTAEMLVVAPVVGLGVSLVGALLPARRLARVAPIEALSDLGATRPSVNRAIVSAVGGAVAAFGTGLTRLVPGASRGVMHLATSNVRRRPAATAAAASTLMVGLVLVGVVAVAGASVRDGLATRFETESTADLYLERRGVVRVDRDSLIAELQSRGVPIAGAAEVVAVDGLLVTPAGTENRVVAGFLESIDSVVDIGVRSGSIGGPGTALVSTEVADTLGLALGDPMTLRSTSGAEVEVTVSGTYDRTAFYGPAVVHIDDAQQIGADGTFELLAVRFPDGVSQRRAGRALERAALQFPRVRVNTTEEFVALNTSVADTVLRIVAVLLGAALGIGAVGLSATVALGVLERSTELSRLRAIGASRTQIQTLVSTEAMLVCAGAAVLGLGIGTLIGWVGLGLAPADLVARRVVPWPLLIGVGLGSVFLGALVSLGPARRAADLPPVLAAST